MTIRRLAAPVTTPPTTNLDRQLPYNSFRGYDRENKVQVDLKIDVPANRVTVKWAGDDGKTNTATYAITNFKNGTTYMPGNSFIDLKRVSGSSPFDAALSQAVLVVPNTRYYKNEMGTLSLRQPGDPNSKVNHILLAG
jgi:hypothetical protein